MKKKVLFVCIHYSTRSQMAEALLSSIYGEHFEAQSAGLEPGNLNPLVVQVMQEIGMDNDQHEQCEPAAKAPRMQGDPNGWLASAPCCG